jgi:hypothetical protein
MTVDGGVVAGGVVAGGVVGGLFELIHGVRSLENAMSWWARFGYSVGKTATFTAEEGLALYNVRSAGSSVRLAHGDSDHGLIRLIQWESPTGPGIGASSLRALGSRWGAMLNTNLLAIQNQCEQGDIAGEDQHWIPSVRQDPAGVNLSPFLVDSIHVREMVLCRAETRQVLFQRFGYSNPTYGAVAESAPFPTSQVTHTGIVTAGDPEAAGVFFYERALGLLKTRDSSISEYSDVASREIFQLQEGERYRCWDFDDPRSSSIPSLWRSGRLKFIHFDTEPVVDLRQDSLMGALGCTAYSWRVHGFDLVVKSIETHRATIIGVHTNEFGERSALFLAPDGYHGIVVEATSVIEAEPPT